MLRSCRPWLRVAAGVAAMSLHGFHARASLVIEDFSYTNGVLRGNTGGAGWSGAWGTTTNFTGRVAVESAGDLTYSAGGYSISQTGTGRAYGDYNAFRGINRLIDTNPSGTVWFSVLVQNLLSTDHAGIQFNHHAEGAALSFAEYNQGAFDAQIAGGNLVVRYDSANTTNLLSLALGQTHLLLGRWDIGAGNDRLQLWVDPADILNLGGAQFDRNTANVGDNLYMAGVFTYGASNVGGTRQGYIDALRISDDPDALLDVTGAPEPGPIALLAIGGLALLRRRGLAGGSARSSP